jgi:hypothetical protein
VLPQHLVTASTLVAEIPFIAPVTRPSPGTLYALCKQFTTLTIAFILQVRSQEVKRDKEEGTSLWRAVLVNKVGGHGLEEGDVPRGLRDI